MYQSRMGSGHVRSQAVRVVAVGESRCVEHADSRVLPRVCRLCNRLDIEVDIVTRVVDALLVAGYELRTSADEEDEVKPSWTKDRAIILARLIEVDDEVLHARGGTRDRRHGWVRFVYGNDGPDVVNDYTTNLEELMKPINDYADLLG